MKKLQYLQNREYQWGDFIVEINNITEYQHGRTHKLKTMDGKIHTVPEGWIHMTESNEDS